jgi:hypothetical protein
MNDVQPILISHSQAPTEALADETVIFGIFFPAASSSYFCETNSIGISNLDVRVSIFTLPVLCPAFWFDPCSCWVSKFSKKWRYSGLIASW